MIQLRRDGFVADREEVERLRTQFENSNWVRLPGLLDPQLFSLVLSCIERSRWRDHKQPGFFSEYTLETGAAAELLHFVTNAPKFLATVGDITGFSAFTCFRGRVYRMEPNIGHTDNWHSDAIDGRLVAMSINMAPRGYQGGLLQVRETKSHRMVAEITNIGPGDAILFRVSTDFEHLVTDVLTGEAKTAFAGWFHRDAPSLRMRLRGEH